MGSVKHVGSLEPRWYQNKAVNDTIVYLEAEKGNPVIVIPTGGGKTLVIKLLVQRLNAPTLILSHSKEILEQNFEAIAAYMPDVGVYSAGLGIKLIKDVTVASIQTVYNKPHLFERFKYVIVDEAHLVSTASNSMYQRFLTTFNRPCIGLTATPYRLKDGYIYGEGRLFTSVSFKVSVKELQKEGYLAPLVPYGSVNEFDTKGIAIQGGDFKLSDLAARFNRDLVTKQIVQDIATYKKQCKHMLLFCIDIDHAENVSRLMNEAGVTCEAVHSDKPRDQALLDLKAGKVQAVANVNVLTVGFDFPKVDMIAIIRPTKSPTLHVQMLGRGSRIAPLKEHCVIKDYSGNIKRLGMPDDVKVVEKGKGDGTGDNPFMKECPECNMLHYPAVRQCECGYKFQFEHNLSPMSYTSKPKWYEVTNIKYSVHMKADAPNSLKISYVCGLRVFDEWILIEHKGFAGHKAKHMLKQRWDSPDSPPKTAVMLKAASDKFKVYKKILVDESNKFPQIISRI